MLQQIIICLAVGYGFGCFSTGYVVGKRNHVDLREHGSGNNGSTNALRTLGKKAGALTLLGDVGKSIIAILIMRYVFQDAQISCNLLTLYTGLGVVIGHNFPFWMKFHGGKGIAAMGGAVIMFHPLVAVVLLSVFIIVVAVSRYVSLGSLIGSFLFPVVVAIAYRGDPDYLHMVIVCCIFVVLAFFKHRANIKRLLTGTENKIGQKSK